MGTTRDGGSRAGFLISPSLQPSKLIQVASVHVHVHVCTRLEMDLLVLGNRSRSRSRLPLPSKYMLTLLSAGAGLLGHHTPPFQLRRPLCRIGKDKGLDS